LNCTRLIIARLWSYWMAFNAAINQTLRL
jgi:hypothetical protein